MKKSKPESKQSKQLRSRAEQLLAERLGNGQDIPVGDVKKLIHELDVHQVELEMQNEELRRAQSELQESRDRYFELYDLAPIGYFTLNQKGLIVETNLACASLLGVVRSGLIKMGFSAFVAPDFQNEYNFYLKRVLETENRQTLELELVKRDGTRFYARLESIAVRGAEGDFNQIRTAIADITERKQAEEVLRASEEKYKTLAESSPTAIFIYQDGEYVFFNDEFARLHGYSKEELLEKEVWELNHPDEKETLRQITSKMLEGKAVFARHAVRRLGKDGKTIWCEMMATHIPYKGRPAIMGNLINIDERKRIEAEKEKLEVQLQQAQKMEAIGTLAGGIAHDFNNLLMGIQGNVSLMLMNMDSMHPYYKWLENIEKQVESGAALTSRLMGYARKGKYEVKPVNLNQIVKETSETFGRTKKEITIHRELAEDLFAIEADPRQIQQVLLNLFINAADAMPGGGDLILRTMNTTHKDMKGKLYEPKPGNYVLLTVTDTGTGMDKKTMENIFDPFFTTKNMGRGTGLGLASAYGIIKGHGGYIDVESEKGHGTTFSIYLPASQKKVLKAVKTAERLIKGTETVLLVDDEEMVLKIGQELLEAMGYTVLIARDGKKAIEVYKKNQDDIDIVVLDMIMPNMGGGETYDRMKEINPDIKVLLSSGFSVDGEATQILERGCNGFIQKPFTMIEISTKIREILEEAKLCQTGKHSDGLNP
ncbi:MAG: PAS domain S-box protein [Proteobacteria bacterium]|nr:PAS domain S-box protein [Pseudomonadota bacterium]MBU4259527.1 PAS domain S-box protein [Pseudomonadota bacterium]MBU4287858.1 PAS domain S-box protein [Pseudomonadota bacterium]MBU4415507.1 PAS domain S-box protein [Pseudomonadota bacterium]MCG2758893.1 PAS domain S-box protein [Desulfobacteraceae bacterium]